MKKTKMSIEIVSSPDIRFSSMSDRSRRLIYKTLTKHYENVTVTLVSSVKDLEALVLRKPDLVVLGMKYFKDSVTGEQIWTGAYLEEREIAITGSSSRAHFNELSKDIAKQRVSAAGLSTSPHMVARRGQELPERISLAYPLFIKPVDRGGGLGIDSQSVVNNYSELVHKVDQIHATLQSSALIEEYLPGREFSVAILDNPATGIKHIMPIELSAGSAGLGSNVLSSEEKAANTEIILPLKNNKLRSAVTKLAEHAFTALGGRDYGRIDIRLDSNETPHFLEANLIPSIIEGYGSFPKACKLNQNLCYEKMLLQIVSLGMMRSASTSNSLEISPTDMALLQTA